MRDAIVNLLKVKSLVTLALTAGMLLLLSGIWTPAQEVITIYSSAWGSVITYFFCKDKEDNIIEEYEEE